MAQTAQKAFELIQSAHQRNRLAHAFLISGAYGSGKEELASRLITLLNGEKGCKGLDLFGDPIVEKMVPLNDQESDLARIIRPRSKSRQISIEAIRELEQSLQRIAPRGKTKVVVLVDADQMNEKSENAFLKTLEEPPEGSLLLLLTTRPQRLLPTVLSRCVHIKLLGGHRLAENIGKSLIENLNQATIHGFGDPITALKMKSIFAKLLQEKREEVEATAKAAAKEEVAAYRDTTDGSWLKEREDFHKASAEAEYLEARNRYLDVILAWVGDILRIKTGSEGLDFPESRVHLQKLADQQSFLQIVHRVEALERLRQTLETNAFEPLALDVGFLKSFA